MIMAILAEIAEFERNLGRRDDSHSSGVPSLCLSVCYRCSVRKSGFGTFLSGPPRRISCQLLGATDTLSSNLSELYRRRYRSDKNGRSWGLKNILLKIKAAASLPATRPETNWSPWASMIGYAMPGKRLNGMCCVNPLLQSLPFETCH
jgi:hypothetical protein